MRGRKQGFPGSLAERMGTPRTGEVPWAPIQDLDLGLEKGAMENIEDIVKEIHEAFGNNEYPGDAFLQGSFEGCEPFEEVAPFQGKTDWRSVDPGFLDGHAGALSFFSEAGFRYFLPAYLVADLQGRLSTADPVFHLTHGFSDSSVEVPTKTRTFTRKIGKSAFLNPRRYGAMTWYDYSRYRLSVFTKEEARAIVAYLRYKRDSDSFGLNKDCIDGALDSFWGERSLNAPSAGSLEQHRAEEEKYSAELKSGSGRSG
jgi:hypothetical protein